MGTKIEKLTQEIKEEINKLGFNETSNFIVMSIVTKKLTETNDENEIHLLLTVFRNSILEDKEKSFNKHMENMRFFLFDK